MRQPARSGPDESEAASTSTIAGGSAYASASVVGRAQQQVGNPYLVPQPEPPVSLAAPGSSVVLDVATGAPLLAGLGALSATQATVIADALSAANVADVVRATVRG